MKFGRSLWKVFRPFVNFPHWMGFSSIKRNTLALGSFTKSVFSTQQATRQENFDDAKRRLNLSEQGINSRKRQFLAMASMFYLAAALILAYALWRLSIGHYLAFFVSIVIALIAIAEAFLNHLWFIQVKHRQLGLNVNDVLRLTFGLKRKSGIKKYTQSE